MDTLHLFLVLLLGVVVGISMMLVFFLFYQKWREKLKAQDIDRIINQMKESFLALSYEALSKNTEEFLKLADVTLKTQSQMGVKELEEKKKLIDQNLSNITERLKEIGALVKDLEKDREQKFGQLAIQLRTTAEETIKLRETTEHLKAALASSKWRGIWGERMAEDILRLLGFIEGVNYQRQKTISSNSGRPDYIFFLPNNLKVNMDVKFPLDNYLRYLDAKSNSEQDQFRTQFLRDVKERIKEVTTRDYINPAENTVDYVLLFIPNEQVYGFIHEADSSILDEALKRKVILCSPLTLYAVLAVIRQAVENFHMEQRATQVLNLLAAFNKQWQAFLEVLEAMGKKIEEAQQQYQKLTTTRKTQLERPLREIEGLRYGTTFHILENRRDTSLRNGISR